MHSIVVRRLLIVAGAALGLGSLALAYMYSVALRDPVVRRAEVAMLPANAAPLNVLIASDLHVAGPDMPPARLRRLVNGMNGLGADVILLAGDFVSDKRVATQIYSSVDAVRPLAGLNAPLGVFAVPGNHEHWRDMAEIERAFRGGGIALLRNESRAAGPVAVVGIDDEATRNADVAAAVADLPALPALVVTHSPDVIPRVPRTLTFVAAGHTHCGQIRLPLIGAVTYMSRFGNRFACGHIVEGDRHIFIGAGLGTSILPLRFGAVPDLWLVTLRPAGTG